MKKPEKRLLSKSEISRFVSKGGHCYSQYYVCMHRDVFVCVCVSVSMYVCVFVSVRKFVMCLVCVCSVSLRLSSMVTEALIAKWAP